MRPEGRKTLGMSYFFAPLPLPPFWDLLGGKGGGGGRGNGPSFVTFKPVRAVVCRTGRREEEEEKCADTTNSCSSQKLQTPPPLFFACEYVAQV